MHAATQLLVSVLFIAVLTNELAMKIPNFPYTCNTTSLEGYWRAYVEGKASFTHRLGHARSISKKKSSELDIAFRAYIGGQIIITILDHYA